MTGLILQEHINRGDDPNVWVFLAIHDQLVLERLCPGHMDKVLLCEAIVPSAIPNQELVGVLLPCVGKLRARELLHIEIAVRIRVSAQIGLRANLRAECRQGYGRHA
jgi:hypothetical protein